MSPFARGIIYGAGLVGAFVAGNVINFKVKIVKESAPGVAEKPRPAIVALGPAPSEMGLLPRSAEPPPLLESTVLVSNTRSTAEHPPIPIIDFDVPPPPRADEPVDLCNPAVRIIGQQLGHKTGSILNDVPALGPQPGMDPSPVVEPPKLDTPKTRLPSKFPFKVRFLRPRKRCLCSRCVSGLTCRRCRRF